MELTMIPCRRCGEDMPELRLTQYGYHFCVNCSTEKPVVARTMTYGTGDHTWNDIQIMTQEQAARLVEVENASARVKESIDLEMIDFDVDEREISQSRKESIHNLMDEENNGSPV